MALGHALVQSTATQYHQASFAVRPHSLASHPRMVGQLLLLLCLLASSTVGPGLFFLRRLRWQPAEKWCASIGLSLALVAGTSDLNYLLHLPRWTSWLWSLVSLVLTLLCAPELGRLFARRRLRRQCRGFAILFAWGLLLLGLVRHYSGGAWFGDWFEHYDRARFFVEQQGRYAPLFNDLPARPPFMNLVAAHYLGQVGLSYPCFQVICLFLNLLIFFPLCLVAPLLAGRRAHAMTGLLVVLLLLNPLFQQNLTWTWTKLLTGFYVVLALWFYQMGWRRGDSQRLTAAFLCLATGFLVHYSAGPYIVFFALHYLLVAFPKRPHRWRELGRICLLCSVLLATWFYWSMEEYGTSATFAGNSTMTEFQSQRRPAAEKLDNILHNLMASFVPHPFHLPKAEFDRRFVQPSRWGYWRDYLFLIYQTSYILALGCVGGVLALGMAVRSLRGRGAGPSSQRWFWILFFVFCSVAGVVVHPMRDDYGLAHICGQPLILLGVTYLAARFRTLPLSLRWLLVLGLIVDFSLGIFLHFNLQHHLFRYANTPTGIRINLSGDDLSRYAIDNWRLKHKHQLVYLGDSVAPLVHIFDALLLLGFALAVGYVIRAAQHSGPTLDERRPPGEPAPEKQVEAVETPVWSADVSFPS